MLISYLEQGNTLSSLSRSQMLAVENAFLLYLLKATTFREAFSNCERILDDDQEPLRVVIKAKLSHMIEDADCNSRFKPAILRLAAGDDAGFRSLQSPTRRTQRILDANKSLIDKRLDSLAFPVSVIGPKHLASIESEHIKVVRPHAIKYVQRYARFLTMGDSGTTVEDLAGDLMLLALRALRWYYPFLKDLHLSNTMRRTITNRGRGLITYSVAGSRKRLIMDDRGRMVNRESSVEFDSATNWRGWSDDPSREVDLRVQLRQVASGNDVSATVAKFILSPDEQEAFCVWLETRIPAVVGSDDVATAVKRSGLPYDLLLSKFLSLPRNEVQQALLHFRKSAA